MKPLSYIGISAGVEPGCENLVLMCMDFRFHRRLGDVLGFAGYREFDVLAMPGSSKALCESASRGLILDSIATAIAVHGVKRVLIVDHVDCRAYGGSEACSDPDAEARMHERALREAALIVLERFPDLEVVPVYAAWDYAYVVE